MPNTIVDIANPHSTGVAPRNPADLPHGIVKPPEEILAQLSKERAKFSLEIFTDSYAKAILDDWTLAYYYEGLDVAYRSVAGGVEVLAVDLDEIGDLLKAIRPDQRSGVQIKQA